VGRKMKQLSQDNFKNLNNDAHYLIQRVRAEVLHFEDNTHLLEKLNRLEELNNELGKEYEAKEKLYILAAEMVLAQPKVYRVSTNAKSPFAFLKVLLG
jgi:ribosome assembly protein YihI (activator of Der GTPase)